MMIAIAIAAGALTWLLSEYLIHRFLGHGKRTKRTQFGREHTKHHALGNYFAPAQTKAAAALPVALLMLAAASLIGGPLIGGVYTASFAATYILYEVLHRRSHTHPPAGFYSRWLRRHHFYHHFGDPKMNHGVTTPIGDWLLATNHTPGKIRVPEKLAMHWLIDPSTGDVFEAFAGDYELLRRGGGAETDGAAPVAAAKPGLA